MFATGKYVQPSLTLQALEYSSGAYFGNPFSVKTPAESNEALDYSKGAYFGYPFSGKAPICSLFSLMLD